MTISANDRRKEYAGNGVTTVFAGPRAFQSSHISVYLVEDETGDDSLVSANDYTLTGVNGNGATSITMDTAPADGYTLVILRTVSFTQDTDITNQGAYLPEVIEDALDALEQQIQQLDDLYDTALHLRETYVGGASTELPDPRALYALRWNSGATALENYLPGDDLEWPQVAETAGRALVAADAFTRMVYGDYGAATFYLPANVFDQGDEFIIVNDSTSDLTLVANNAGSTAPVTLYHAGHGRTWSSAGGKIPTHSVARVYMTSASRGYISCVVDDLNVVGFALNRGQTWAYKRQLHANNALTSSAGVANIDLSLGNYFTLTLTENVTSITFSNLPVSGFAQTIWIRIAQHASSAKTVAWPASFKWEGGVAPSVSTTLSAYDNLALTSVDEGTRWEASLAKGFA